MSDTDSSSPMRTYTRDLCEHAHTLPPPLALEPSFVFDTVDGERRAFSPALLLSVSTLLLLLPACEKLALTAGTTRWHQAGTRGLAMCSCYQTLPKWRREFAL